MTHYRVLGTIIVAALVLVACAQTSQQVRLAPEAGVSESRIGDGRDIALRVVDQRDEPVLGYLENRRGSPGELTSATAVDHVVRNAVEQALEANGFVVREWDGDAERRLDVTVLNVEHNVSAGLARDVTTSVELRSAAFRGDSSLTGRATSRNNDRISHRPDASQNAAYLDAVIGRAIERLVNIDMLDFLASD